MEQNLPPFVIFCCLKATADFFSIFGDIVFSSVLILPFFQIFHFQTYRAGGRDLVFMYAGKKTIVKDFDIFPYNKKFHTFFLLPPSGEVLRLAQARLPCKGPPSSMLRSKRLWNHNFIKFKIGGNKRGGCIRLPS